MSIKGFLWYMFWAFVGIAAGALTVIVIWG